MFKHLLSKFASSLHTTKVVESPAEEEAIYRFRYKIFVEHMNMKPNDIDMEKKSLSSPFDQEERTLIIYTGSIDDIDATISLRIWEKGCFPESFQKKYDTKIIPNFKNLKVAEFNYFMIDPTKRSKLIPLSLFKKLYDVLSERNIHLDIIFCYCGPGLVPTYEKLGLKVYTPQFMQLADGIRVPMMMLPFDETYLKAIHSPTLSFAKSAVQKMNFKPSTWLSDSALSMVKNTHTVISKHKDVREAIYSSNLNSDNCKLMQMISVKDLAQLSGIVMKIPHDFYIIKKGTENREIYVILEGKVEVEINGKPIKRLGKGDVFGEVAFFLEDGKRTADIRVMTPLTMVVIRRNDVTRIMKSNKSLAVNFLYAISRIICTRLADVTEAFPKH